LIDRQKRLKYDHKTTSSSDPFYRYAQWVKEQKIQQEQQTRKKQKDFLKKKAFLKESKLYYPYMIALYLISIGLMGLSVLVLIGCAFAILKYHIFMFFFLLPFICGAAYVLKITLDGYKKYKAIFS
ncbi:MAG TPA: hypothetical protein VK766_08850, partial [Cytophagaceae bacterium]|nr:hypothetical protein [Cytophagaceae bacterium]